MKIISAELVTSASTGGPRRGVVRDDVPQFAFWGRSNVGKSSLLNALTRQKVARTSAAAGKTRQANIFRITADGGSGGPGSWTSYFVDLPGYGYARGGHESVSELAVVVQAYFAAAKGRAAIFLLIDSRHPGLAADVEAYRWISQTTAPYVIATKVDKLSRSERTQNLGEIERVFEQPPLPVSASSGEGLDQLWRVISAVASRAER